ncbi:MAG: pyrroline-5-carboxylate reductase [Clostridiales bacterium]|nr:pyrroline-5-carboxylate reductase [Clostridiales bacterium]
MEKKFKLGVIGAGFMATAIIKGALKASILSPEDVIVSDPNEISLDKMAKNGVCVTQSNLEVASNSEFVLFAIKPQNLSQVLESIKSAHDCKFISIMAGVRKEKIKNYFPLTKIARCMPNTPCAIGSGAVGLDVSDFSDDEDIQFIVKLFDSLASVVMVNEDKLNAVTGVSGSAPAYFYLFLKGIIDAGVQNGLTEEQAKVLATSTMIGAGKMVLNNDDKSLDELINAVCSKGGTTIEAVKVYENERLSNITLNAINACVKRATELEKL